MSSYLFNSLERSITAIAGRLHYTERQLYYELCRTVRPVPGLSTPLALRAFALGLLPSLLFLRQPQRAAGLAMADLLVVATLRLMHAWPATRPVPLPYEAFLATLATYRARCGEPPGLLPPAGLLHLAPPGSEPDLLDYGLERVLICQHDDLAHMLLANRFPMEVKCAVLSLSSGLPDPIRAMLARTPGATVSLLHDASMEGLGLVDSLRDALEIPAAVRVAAIGLRPAHAMQLRLFARRAAPPPDTGADWPAYLSPQEKLWLGQGWQAELAAIHPLRLLLKLRRILTGNLPPPWRLFDLRRDREIGFMTWPHA